MTQLHDDLLAVLDAVEIESPSRYRVLGVARELSDPLGDGTRSKTGPDTLVSRLAIDLYDRLYIRPNSSAQLPADELSRRDFLAALSKANTGRGSWEPGWIVRQIEADDRVVVAKDDVAFWAPVVEVRARGDTLRPGDRCRVWLAKERRALVSGFYLAIGDAESDDDHEETEQEGRFYWHLASDAAVPFMAIATSLLNESRLPFRVKVLSDPNAYHRADAGVIYFRRRDDRRIGPMIARIHSAIAHGLRAEVPLFTKRLRDGLGLADTPGAHGSFGEHRCRLVAAALWDFFVRHEVDRSAQVVSLATAFVQAGLDPLRPHLGRGESDDCFSECFRTETLYERADSRSVSSNAQASFCSETPRRLSMLEAAARIGGTLCLTAHWDREGQHCNWIGRTNSQVSDNDSPITPVSAALGPGVYAGTAGIALFLSQLHAMTGDQDCRRTAGGAIAQSTRQFNRKPLRAPLSPISFFSGDLGAAYVARRVATQIGHAELLSTSESILDRVVESAVKPHMLDVISGNAGAIPVLLAMGREPGLDQCAALATLLGEELCQVDPSSSGVSGQGWDHLPGLERDALTPSGLSHGTAGLGLSLLELYAATGRSEFRDAARRSFEYEDTLFDPTKRNWADARRPSGFSRFDRFWCNGAPGIALARLRAAALDPDRRDDNLYKARLAIETTLEAIDENLRAPRPDTSLCHGLTGLGEIILIAGHLLDEPSLDARAVALAQALIDRYALSGEWPSGTLSGGPNPSLMVGIAGIGYWLLRLHDPAKVPPFLLLIP